MSTRELLDPIMDGSRRNDQTTADDSMESEWDAAGSGGEAVNDSGVGNSVVGWASGTTLSVGWPFDAGAGLRGRAIEWSSLSGAPPLSPGSLGKLVAGLESWQEDAGMAARPSADNLQELADVTADTARDISSTTWAELLDSVWYADWESIDREMRHLLGNIGGLASPPESARSTRVWLAWVGGAAIVYLGHRASAARRRDFRRNGRRAAPAPLPIGPWPLSAP